MDNRDAGCQQTGDTEARIKRKTKKLSNSKFTSFKISS